MSEDALRSALKEAMHQAVDYDGLDLSTIGPKHWYRIAEAALAAHPARASQGELSDEQIVAALKACDVEDHTQEGWIWRQRIKWARAVIAADSAARPESVDARRLDWLEGEYAREQAALAANKPVPPSLFRGNLPINREAIDAAMQADAAIAKGEQT